MSPDSAATFATGLTTAPPDLRIAFPAIQLRSSDLDRPGFNRNIWFRDTPISLRVEEWCMDRDVYNTDRLHESSMSGHWASWSPDTPIFSALHPSSTRPSVISAGSTTTATTIYQGSTSESTAATTCGSAHPGPGKGPALPASSMLGNQTMHGSQASAVPSFTPSTDADPMDLDEQEIQTMSAMAPALLQRPANEDGHCPVLPIPRLTIGFHVGSGRLYDAFRGTLCRGPYDQGLSVVVKVCDLEGFAEQETDAYTKDEAFAALKNETALFTDPLIPLQVLGHVPRYYGTWKWVGQHEQLDDGLFMSVFEDCGERVLTRQRKRGEDGLVRIDENLQ